MREKITYIAFDGTEFASEIVCEKYERERYKEKYCDTLVGYDTNGAKMDITDMDNFIDKSDYIICKDDDAANFIEEKIREFGYTSDGIYGAGAYFYEDDYWYTIDYAIDMRDKYAEIVEILSK